MSRSNDKWLQFYQNNHQSWSGEAAAVVTATNSSVSNQLSRVTRPTNTSNNRRRSRASRKTPTTLLNTDTTNFRAMVQHFTGGGAAPLPSTSVTESFNTYSTTTSSNINHHDGRNVQLPQPHSQQPYFTMTVDDGGSSTAYDGDDQNLGYGQKVSYNW